jgi:hypothetical protein
MRKEFPGFYLKVATLYMLGCMTWAAGCLAQRSSPSKEASMKRFLRDYAGTLGSDGDKSTRYSASFVDLSGHGKQDVIVYVTGQSWCGSGGCTTLLLSPSRSSYKLVTKITISRLPIRVLSTEANGWHDVSVHVQGGGIQPG